MRQELFLALTQDFLERRIQVRAFCTKYIRLWAKERDVTYVKKAEWPLPYDEMLVAAWQRGEISDDQFKEKVAQLWGYEANSQDVLDGVHSACDCWRLSPELKGEIDEMQLRHEVEEAFAALTQPNKVLVQAA